MLLWIFELVSEGELMEVTKFAIKLFPLRKIQFWNLKLLGLLFLLSEDAVA